MERKELNQTKPTQMLLYVFLFVQIIGCGISPNKRNVRRGKGNTGNQGFALGVNAGGGMLGNK